MLRSITPGLFSRIRIYMTNHNWKRIRRHFGPETTLVSFGVATKVIKGYRSYIIPTQTVVKIQSQEFAPMPPVV